VSSDCRRVHRAQRRLARSEAHTICPFETPRGLDHGLAYEAIAGRQVDAIDIYSTDAKLDKYGLTVLTDDRQYFPRTTRCCYRRRRSDSPDS
jgi:hypothetical protein